MGSNAGLKLIGTYVPKKLAPKIKSRAKKIGKTVSIYLRDLIAADLSGAGIDLTEELTLKQGRPRNPEEETEQ